MGRKALSMNEIQESPLEIAVKNWWQAISQAESNPTQEFLDRIVGQGKVFFRLTDELSKNLQAGTGDADWPGVLEKTFRNLQDNFSSHLQADGKDEQHRTAAFWEMPLNSWQQMVSSLSLLPGGLPQDGNQEAIGAFLSMPGLGFAREEQEQQQKFARLVLEYQQALSEYMRFFSQLGLHSVPRMQKKLEGRDTPIESARELFDLWNHSCEEVYSEEITTEEYALASARMVNASMAVKREAGVMVDKIIGALNMPTRRELLTLQERMQETRRENRRLRNDVDILKEQVANLTMAMEKSRAAPKKKAAVRRKPAKAKAKG